jgi:hypothetical protein
MEVRMLVIPKSDNPAKFNFIFEEKSEKIQNNPKFSYPPIHRGEAASLQALCENANIQTSFSYGSVRIFSKTKIPQFKDLIAQNLLLFNQKNGLTHKLQKWSWNNNITFCVGLQRDDTIYTYVSVLEKVIINQYRGVIPVTNKINISETREEMLIALIKRGVIV